MLRFSITPTPSTTSTGGARETSLATTAVASADCADCQYSETSSKSTTPTLGLKLKAKFYDDFKH